MASSLRPPDPNETLRRVMPRTGPPVQNSGGYAPNTAPLAQRPVAAPVVRPTPGPAPAIPPPPANAKSAAPQVGTVPATFKTAPAAPAPAAPAVGAPAPAPAVPAAPSGGYTPYGPSGGGAPTLEGQIRDYITSAMGGVTSKAFIDRAKNQLGSAVEGQRGMAVRRINDDAIRRGLFRSGIPQESIALAETGASSALSRGIADILSRAEQQDIAGRESAAGVAGNLLSMNREEDRYQQERADAQAARAAANAPRDTSFTYIDPDTGQSYQMDESWF